MDKGVWLVLGTAVISGVSIFANAFGVLGINPDIFTFAKNALVALVLVSILLIAGQWKHVRKLPAKDWGLLSLIGFVGGAVPFVLFFRGLQLSTAAAGSFLQKTMFAFVMLFSLVLLKEQGEAKESVRKYIIPGLLLLAGNFLLLNMGVSGFPFGAGELLILVSTVLWALENTLSKKAVSSRNISGTMVAAARMGFGAIFLALYLAWNGTLASVMAVTSGQTIWILVTAAFLLAYVLTWYNGIKTVSITLATVLLQIGAPITILLQFMFLKKDLFLAQSLGMVLIVGAVVYLLLNEKKDVYSESVNSTA